jgi:glutathionylspermidine synthase
MRRMCANARHDWRQSVERQGLVFHTLEDGQSPYWDESVYYLLTAREVDELEKATYFLDRMCLEAVEHVLKENLLEQFGIHPRWRNWLLASWERDEQTIVGRFDLVYDGERPPALLEYNADTPTSLLEAAVIQWFWLQDFRDAQHDPFSTLDQFNSLHENLIEAWRRVGSEVGDVVHFASLAAADSVEDYMTATYLRDTAIQAGLETASLAVEDIGWNAQRGKFVDMGENWLATVFKLYPWEWMLEEDFADYLLASTTRWLEPPWKMILSNKALLPLLYELFPDSPYILEAHREPWGETFVRKPIHSREGAGVSLIQQDQVIAQTWDGESGPFVYQALRPLPAFDGRHIVFGSWMVNGRASGIGIRESDGLITGNTSRFVPHLFYR